MQGNLDTIKLLTELFCCLLAGGLFIFIFFDILTTIIQVGGAAIIANDENDGKDPSTGANILKVGLAIHRFPIAFLCGLVPISRARDFGDADH